MPPRCSLKTRLWSFHRGKLTWGTLPHPSNHLETTATSARSKSHIMFTKTLKKKHLLKSMRAIWVWIILHAHSSKIFLYKTDIALTLLLRKKRFYQEVSDVRIYWTDIIKDNNSITDVFIKLCLHSRNVWSSWKLILILSSSRYGLLWWPDHIGNMRTINFKNRSHFQ